MKRSLVGILVLFFLICSVGTASASCIGEVTGIDYRCGDTVIENCTLNENLNCTTKYGLITGADGITIDGNGYTLSGSEEYPDSEGIRNEGCNNVTVKNLKIEGFCFGIYFKDAGNCTVVNNTISYGVGSGIWLFSSLYNRITNNEVNYGKEGHGILLSDNATDNVLGYNKIKTADGMGICMYESNENEFYYNFVCGNARGDIIVESGYGNVGNNNTCNTTANYNDTGSSACTYSCSRALKESVTIEPTVTTGKSRHSCGCVSPSGKIFECGDIVTGSCTFNCNLSCPAGHGLIIGADGIIIDGGGYVLDGVEPGMCSGLSVQRSGIYNPGHDGVVIRNLEVKNFCNGIYLKGDEVPGNLVYNNTIINCGIHHNGNDIGETATHGIKLKYVYRSTIMNNLVHHNKGKGDSCEGGGNGIFLYAGDYNDISNNTVCDNTKAGIFTKMKPMYNNISYNEVKGNGQGGIILRCKCSSSFSIEHNIATDNKGPGIYVGGPDNALRFNTVTNNRNGSIYRNDASVADGIRISREAYNTTLISNNVTGNDDVDVYVREGLTATGYNNSFQTHLNYEDSSLKSEGKEEVMGKKMVVWEEMYKEVKQGIEIPPVKVTPLMATLIVVIALAFILYGYLRRKT
jgi:parallel beta-helix repeat protein